MTTAISKKNGTIELLRFIFCLCILLFHIEKYLFGEPPLDEGIHLELFPHGSIGVEFFFLVSGWLMASSIVKMRQRETLDDLGNLTLGFMKKKYFSIFPYHIVALLGTFVVDCYIRNVTLTEIVRNFVEMIPNIFLVQMSGLSMYNPNHITWYLSSMLIAMFILFPLTYKYYNVMIKIIIPFVSIVVLGNFFYNDHAITGVAIWTAFGYKGTIRAFIDISLGMLAYEISKALSSTNISGCKKTLLAVVEFCCYLSTIIFALMTFTKEYEFFALLALFVGIAITFSEVTHTHIFDNKFCYFLGSFSLPVYLCQLAAINIGVNYTADFSPEARVIIVVLLTTVFAALCNVVGNYIIKRTHSSKK